MKKNLGTHVTKFIDIIFVVVMVYIAFLILQELWNLLISPFLALLMFSMFAIVG